MAIAQDQLAGNNTLVTFEDFNNEKHSGIVFHDGKDIVKCEFFDPPTDPRLAYYRTNGDKAVSYNLYSQYVVDISYDPVHDKYYELVMVQSEANPWFQYAGS